MKPHFAIIALTASLMLLAGCGGTGPAPEPVEIPGYGTLQEPLKGRNVSALAGRRVVLDPGHGGYFKGAVGRNGLTEAEVNLGVALHLRGLLEWAGAEVWMTRTADTDFLTVADSTLASDLAFRVAFIDSLQPDVFLSLHHNSVASLDRTINETQTYYPLGDGGASLDLARAIHRHLVLNLEITPAKILPGNFHVLRHATVPAVLGEPAMISNPVIEGRLSLAASQRLEAEAYFLGLLDYFGQGNPVWSGAARDTLPFPGPGEAPAKAWTYFTDGIGREDSAGPGLDPTSVRVTLDGTPQPFDLGPDGRTVRWRAPGRGLDAAAELEITARNLAGRRTPVRRTLVPATRATVIRVTAYTDISYKIPPYVSWETANGRPAPEGRLAIGPDLPGLDLVLEIGGLTHGGQGVHPSMWPEGDPTPTFIPADEGAPVPTVVFHTASLPEPWRWVHLFTSGMGSMTNPGPVVMRSGAGPDDARPGRLPPFVPLVAWYTPDWLWLEAPGYLPRVLPPAGEDHGNGTSGSEYEPLLRPLRDQVIIIDPAGGGGDTDGTGPLGLRGADLNLTVARQLANLLRGAGAIPHLTRTDGTVPSPEEKVAQAGRVGADWFLTIGRTRAPGGPTIAHHHGSVNGTRWSQLVAEATVGITAPGDSITITPAWDYLLRHTACPALEVRLPGPVNTAVEMRQNDRAWQRAEAAVLFQALAAVAFGHDALLPVFEPEAFLASDGVGLDPSSVDLLVLDGQFAWAPRDPDLPAEDDRQDAPDPLSSWQEPGWPIRGGWHTVEVRHRGGWTLYLMTGPGQVEILMSGS